MTFDRFCQFTVLGLLPLLWLPFAALKWALAVAVFIMLCGIFRRQALLILLGTIWLFGYARVVELANIADQVMAGRSEEIIRIVQILKQQDFQTAIAETHSGEQLYLTWQSEKALELGAEYQAQLQYRPISARLNEGNFNRQRWYLAQGITRTATVKQAERIKLSQSFRVGLLAKVKEHLADTQHSGLLLALSFGERAWLPLSEWQIFQNTTTAHLIAISGLHIGLAFGVGLLFAKGVLGIYLRFGGQQAVCISPIFASTIGFIFALAYSYLAGGSIPTLRALLAISVVLACRFARRYYTPWQLWWRIVALLLVLEPLSLLSDSFWLSVSAVAVLIVWYQFFPLSAWLSLLYSILPFCKKTEKPNRLLLGLFHLQLGIWLLFMPIQFFFFGGTSPFAFLANLLLVPLYSFVLVPVILFSLITVDFFQTWQLADRVAALGFKLIAPMADFWWELSWQQQWLWLSINTAFLLGLIALYYPVFRKACFMLSIVPFLFWGVIRLSKQNEIEWIHFDVGQGLAMAFIYEPGRAVLYDTGAAWAGGSMAELEIIPYLKRRGIGIDAIFISHDDNDHSGGVKPLLQAFPNARLILSGENHYSSKSYETCRQGERWQFGQVVFQAIFPKKSAVRAKNEDSCVLLVSIGQHRLLLTGDSGVVQEREFAAQVGKIDFLQVGHHGSRTSTSSTLLAHVVPEWAIISAGRWNAWKLPNREVVQRLTQSQANVLNTAYRGMIKVGFSGGSYQIQTARSAYTPWYSKIFGQQIFRQ